MRKTIKINVNKVMKKIQNNKKSRQGISRKDPIVEKAKNNYKKTLSKLDMDKLIMMKESLKEFWPKDLNETANKEMELDQFSNELYQSLKPLINSLFNRKKFDSLRVLIDLIEKACNTPNLNSERDVIKF